MNVNCPECRDGEVFPPVDGTDPHGRYASAPCSACGGTGMDGSTYVPATHLTPSEAEPCPSCRGSGLNPVALEAACRERQRQLVQRAKQKGINGIVEWDDINDADLLELRRSEMASWVRAFLNETGEPT